MKTKKQSETYAVYYNNFDDPDTDYEFKQSFGSLEKAEKYIEDRNRETMNDDNIEDWSWGYIIFKEIKNVKYTSKVSISRTLVGVEQ